MSPVKPAYNRGRPLHATDRGGGAPDEIFPVTERIEHENTVGLPRSRLACMGPIDLPRSFRCSVDYR